MTTALIHFLDRVANWKSLLLLFVLYISFPAWWLKNAEIDINQFAGKTIGPIDLTFGFDPARTLQMVADYGPAARAYYTRIELTVDVVYPLVYSFLFAVILTLLFRNRLYKPFARVTLLPFVSGLFDLLENVAIVGLLTGYPAQSPALAVWCEVAKLGKWLSFGLIIGLILYGLIRLPMSKIQTSSY